jgi:hypothetical protein
MPRFEHDGGADHGALAHPPREVRARSVAPTQFRSAAVADWRASTSGDVLVANRPTPRIDSDELWDRLGDFA